MDQAFLLLGGVNVQNSENVFRGNTPDLAVSVKPHCNVVRSIVLQPEQGGTVLDDLDHELLASLLCDELAIVAEVYATVLLLYPKLDRISVF
jgi:hypothetical protein